jgi:regulation of enolase protein 1 (concanavalin A-like superfamily)
MFYLFLERAFDMNRIVIVLLLVSLYLGCNAQQASKSIPSGAVVRDNFDGQFDLSWNIQGENPLNWSLSEVPGTLTIKTEDGTYLRNRKDYKNLFLVPNTFSDTQDFLVTVCLVEFTPVEQWNQAGLVLWNDEDNFLTFAFEYRGGSQPVVAIEVDGHPYFEWFHVEQNLERVWLRVIKQGNVCELFVSADGDSFTPAEAKSSYYDELENNRIEWPINFPVKSIGLFANNGSRYDALPVTASFDFFEIETLPKEADQ